VCFPIHVIIHSTYAELERFQTASASQGHSLTLTMVQFDRPNTISY